MHVVCWTSKETKHPVEEIWVRGPTPRWDSGEDFVNHMILTCCSSVTDRNWKWQNTGGALAVTKGLVGQIEGLVGKFPPTTLYDKNAPQQRHPKHALQPLFFSECKGHALKYRCRSRTPSGLPVIRALSDNGYTLAVLRLNTWTRHGPLWHKQTSASCCWANARFFNNRYSSFWKYTSKRH